MNYEEKEMNYKEKEIEIIRHPESYNKFQRLYIKYVMEFGAAYRCLFLLIITFILTYLLFAYHNSSLSCLILIFWGFSIMFTPCVLGDSSLRSVLIPSSKTHCRRIEKLGKIGDKNSNKEKSKREIHMSEKTMSFREKTEFIENFCKEKGILYEIFDYPGGWVITFPDCKFKGKTPKVVCNYKINYHQDGYVESHHFPWDHGSAFLLMPKEFCEKLEEYYKELGIIKEEEESEDLLDTSGDGKDQTEHL